MIGRSKKEILAGAMDAALTRTEAELDEARRFFEHRVSVIRGLWAKATPDEKEVLASFMDETVETLEAQLGEGKLPTFDDVHEQVMSAAMRAVEPEGRA